MIWLPLATRAVLSQLQCVSIQLLRASLGRRVGGAQPGAVLKGFLTEEALDPGFLKICPHPPWVGIRGVFGKSQKTSSLAVFGGLVCPTSLKERSPNEA